MFTEITESGITYLCMYKSPTHPQTKTPSNSQDRLQYTALQLARSVKMHLVDCWKAGQATAIFKKLSVSTIKQVFLLEQNEKPVTFCCHIHSDGD